MKPDSRCGYCGGRYEDDICVDCERKRGDLPKPFLFLAPGAMGDYRTLEAAQAALQWHTDAGQVGALYIRVDVAVMFGMTPVGAREDEG